MMRNRIYLTILAVVATYNATALGRDIRKEQVRFEKGASGATIEGSITGYETVDYVLRAAAGQAMNVSMATDNSANFFNVIPPGETDVAIFNGSTSENQYEGVLPKTGDYKIRVYLERSAARRDEVANFRLEMNIAAAGATASQATSDAPPGLADLVGARGSSGERALEERGYTWINTVKSDRESVTYWRANESGHCVAVTTADGRYAAIATTDAANCKAAPPATTPGSDGGFPTVCGVIVDGKTHRYRCVARDVYSGAEKTETILQYPDMTIRLQWKTDNRVGLLFEGMVPQEATYATYEGETNFVFEGKTYFYISNQDMAQHELKSFED